MRKAAAGLAVVAIVVACWVIFSSNNEVNDQKEPGDSGAIAGADAVSVDKHDEHDLNQQSDAQVIAEAGRGFVFYNGRYIPPPYLIAIDHDGVTVNDIRVIRAPENPAATPAPTVDPGPFQWTPDLEAKEMHESGFVKHAVARFIYWREELGFDEACERFEAYLKEQPLVVKVYRGGDGDFGIRYETEDGESDGFGFSRVKTVAREDQIKADNERLTQDADNLRHTLADGGAVFFGPSRVYMPSSKVKDLLPKIYEILASDEPAQAKAAALVENGLLTREHAQVLVEGFADDVSLQRRIKEIEKGRPQFIEPPQDGPIT